MLRSIKSGQRKMRVIALKIFEGSLVDSLDARQVTFANNSITFKVPFAQDPVILGPAVVAGDKLSVSVSGDGDVLIVGSDTTEKY